MLEKIKWNLLWIPGLAGVLFFYIYDNEEQSGAFHKNPAFDADHGAGLRAAQYVADQGVSLVITGEVGPKASDILNKVKMNIDLRKEEEPLVNILKGIEVG